MVLDENLTNIKKKHKPVLEAKVKKSLARQIINMGKSLGHSPVNDWPSSSEFGTSGRPDLYSFIGPHLFLLEVKSDGGKFSPNQRVWHDRYLSVQPESIYKPPLLTVRGMSGIAPTIAFMVWVIEVRREIEMRIGNNMPCKNIVDDYLDDIRAAQEVSFRSCGREKLSFS